jgi:hypothetical protein
MAEGVIKSPTDTANVGPKTRTYTYGTGAETTHARLGGIVDEAGNELSLPIAEPVASNAPAIPVRQPTGAVFAVSGPITRAQIDAAPIGIYTQGTNTVAVTVGNFPAGFNVNNAVQLAAGGNTIGNVGVNGTVPVSGPLTNTELRATPLPINGTVAVSGTVPVSLASVPSHAVTGPLTNTELRAAAVPVSGTFFQATQPVSLATNTPDVTDRAGRLLGVVTVAALTDGTQKAVARGGAKGTTVAADVTSTPFDANTQAMDVAVKGTAGMVESTALSAISATGTAGAAVTLTIPAPAAGLFNYVYSLEITAYTTVARAGAAAPIVVTSSNLGAAAAAGLTWTFSTAAAIGTSELRSHGTGNAMKAATAAAVTTVVCPATPSVIWRVNATYRQAA